MRGFGCALIASRVSAGSESLSVHSTGSPDRAAQPAAGIANSGLSAGATSDRPGRVAGHLRLQLVDRLGERRRARARHVLEAPVVGLGGRLADADHLRAVELRRRPTARAPRAPRALAAGSSPPSENRIGARSGRRHQLGGGDRRAPVGLVDDHDGLRAALLGARGIDGARHAGGVRDRVGARHARGVLGREDREAEGLRVARPAPRRRSAPSTGWLLPRSPPPPLPPPPQPETARRSRRTASPPRITQTDASAALPSPRRSRGVKR